MANSRHLLNAVIFEAPTAMKALIGRAKSEGLSRYARAALCESAVLSGVALGPLKKGNRGEPLASNGSFWTVSHTSDFVAGVVAPYPIGIDIEKIGPFTPALRSKVAGPGEWVLASDTEKTFCRFWTAKEAVLKAVGAGLGGLSRCTIIETIDDHHTRLEYETKEWVVSHYLDIAGYIASITVPGDRVQWRLSSPKQQT